MTESYRPNFSIRESGLSAPDAKLITPDKRRIKAEELPRIFGIDVKLHTKTKLVGLGIISEESELPFLEDPIIHTYKLEDGTIISSDSQYFLETVIGKDGVLASFLPPFSRTSEHMHEHPIKEIYNKIAGQSLVNVGNEAIALNDGMESVEVPINTEHQVLTRESPAFILIVMKNAGIVPRDQWHKSTNRFSRNKNK